MPIGDCIKKNRNMETVDLSDSNIGHTLFTCVSSAWLCQFQEYCWNPYATSMKRSERPIISIKNLRWLCVCGDSLNRRSVGKSLWFSSSIEAVELVASRSHEHALKKATKIKYFSERNQTCIFDSWRARSCWFFYFVFFLSVQLLGHRLAHKQFSFLYISA